MLTLLNSTVFPIVSLHCRQDVQQTFKDLRSACSFQNPGARFKGGSPFATSCKRALSAAFRVPSAPFIRETHLFSQKDTCCGSKPIAPFWGRCTAHLVHFSGDWDVHCRYDLDFDPWPPLSSPLRLVLGSDFAALIQAWRTGGGGPERSAQAKSGGLFGVSGGGVCLGEG